MTSFDLGNQFYTISSTPNFAVKSLRRRFAQLQKHKCFGSRNFADMISRELGGVVTRRQPDYPATEYQTTI